MESQTVQTQESIPLSQSQPTQSQSQTVSRGSSVATKAPIPSKNTNTRVPKPTKTIQQGTKAKKIAIPGTNKPFKPPSSVQVNATKSPQTRSKTVTATMRKSPLTRLKAKQSGIRTSDIHIEETRPIQKRMYPPKGYGVYHCPQTGGMYYRGPGAKRGKFVSNQGPRNQPSTTHKVNAISRGPGARRGKFVPNQGPRNQPITTHKRNADSTSFGPESASTSSLGMTSALDTLCGQSFGAKQYYMLGIHMQRAMLVVTVISIPIAVIWAYTGTVLTALGQDPEISLEAGHYARWMIPAVFAYGFLQCHIRFLQTQNIVFPAMLSSGFCALLHVLLCWVLVFKSGLGNKGAALANGISDWINTLILAAYIRLSPDCKKTWTGFSREAFRDVLNFIKLAIPSAIMVCLEFWSFEMVVLLSGLLPNPKLQTSVLSISLNTASMVFMVPFGLGAAISTRVSNELGAGRPQDARLAVRVVVLLAISESLIVGLVMILVRNIWGHAYSNEEEVVKYVAVMVPLLATSNLLDGIQCVLSGKEGKG